MGRWIPPKEVARRRIIDEFALENGKGKIVCHGRTFEINQCDDVLDLAQLAELLMMRVAGKLLNPKLRPTVTNRAALRPCKMTGGDYSLASGPAPLPAVTVCDVTGHDVKTHYLRVEINGEAWDNWFGRLDELAKCLYIVVREAQGEPFEGRPMVMVGATGAVPLHG